MTCTNARRSAAVWMALVALCPAAAAAAESGLIGHWKLQGDCRDYSGNGNDGVNHGVELNSGAFDGEHAYIEVPASKSLKLGTGDFSICARIYTEKQLDDIVGDLLDKYDPAARRGITLSINSSAGGFQSQGTDRHIYFGIDNAQASDWQDCGRPSAASNYVSESMTVYKGKLYAATTGGKEESDWRHVYRYEDGKRWADCGQVGDGKAQGVGPLIVHNGELYATTWTVDWTRVREGGYDPGRVYRYLGGTKWENCGQPSNSRTLNCIASYKGKLYVGGGPETWGVFTQDGANHWKTSVAFAKDGPRRCFPHSMAVFNGKLFTGYPVAYSFDGAKWTYAGQPFDYDNGALQLYCFAAHQGKLCVGSWPEGKVAKYEGGEDWREIGRVGEDGTEVNGLVVYNGKLYGGSLPRAEVCRYDGRSKWTSLKRFYSPDGWKPGVPYHCNRKEVNEWVRLTGLTIYDGKLFASTGSCTSSVVDAPTDVRGKVFSMEAGKCASYDDDLGPGWKYLVAEREGGLLKLFVDGKLVAKSTSFDQAKFDVSNDAPLRIGFGQTDYFSGKMKDVRLYNRALMDREIVELAKQDKSAARVQSARIVLAGNASRIDRFAASELQRCLVTALNWNVNITDEKQVSPGEPVFFVGSLDSSILGATAFPQTAKEEILALEVEGVCLNGDGKSVALVGKGPRGGLYAVYEFLEKVVGCHWPEPGREFVPHLSTLKLEIERIHNPTFNYRGVALHGPCRNQFYREIIDWLAKNRMNSLQFSCEIYDQLRPKILDAILDRGLVPKIGAHSRQYFYSSAKYFPTHPQYFALVSGKRKSDTQLCYSNHDSAAEYAKNVIAYLKDRPEIGVVGLWPSDGYGFCECDRCKAKPTTDILLDYVNDVAKRVHAQFPNVKVEFLSYIDYTVPPVAVKPLPYVTPTYCEYRSRNQFHPITEDRASNANCRRQLEQWVKISNEATVYSYYADDVIKRFMYQPVSDVVVSDLQYYRKIGVAGNSVLMMNPQSWWAHGQHMYAYAQVAWDFTMMLDKVENVYLVSLFGAAAEPMRAHQQATRDLFETKFSSGQTGEEILSGFQIKKFNSAHEASNLARFRQVISRIKDSLAAAKSATTDQWSLKRIEVLDQDARLVECIYGILNEAAGYKGDKNDARKDQMRAFIARVGGNTVAAKDDIRCNVLKSLMPHVTAVLGADEAAEYDRVAVVPPE
jgi:hypothetical protein